MAAQTDDTGAGSYRPAERRTFTETKLGFRTSEFLMAVVAIRRRAHRHLRGR